MRHNQVVRWRRFILLVVLLIVGASLVSALSARDRSDDSPPPGVAPAGASRPAPLVEASLPSEKTVRARVGDVVRLLVRAPSADTVELSALAVEEPVDADQPAELVFVADREGRFPVRLRDADEAIGTLRVTS